MTIVCTPRRKATHRARGKTESVTCACQLSGVTPSTMSKRAASATTSQPRCDALGWLVVGPLALQVRRRLACISVSIGEIRGSILEIGRAGFGRRGGTRRGGVSAPCALKGCPANGTFTAETRGGCPSRGTRGRGGPLSLPQPPLSPPSLRRALGAVGEYDLGIWQCGAQFPQGGGGDFNAAFKVEHLQSS